MAHRVASLTQTCERSPAQWEGRLDDGRPVYIRYRHSHLSVQFGEVGGTIGSAIDSDPWFDREMMIDGDAGSASIVRIAEITGLVIDCPVESH